MTKKNNSSLITFCIAAILIFISPVSYLAAQDDSDRSYLQYLYPEFSKGTIKSKTGRSVEIVLNYNMVSERIVYEKDGKLLDLIGIETIDTIFLQNSRFIPFGRAFYELVVEEPVSLYIQHRASIIPPGKPAGYGGTTQTSGVSTISSISTSTGYYNLKLPSDYTVNINPVFWMRKDYIMYDFNNLNQFLKIFPGKENELKKFIKQNNIRFQKREDLIRLVEYCNSLMTN